MTWLWQIVISGLVGVVIGVVVRPYFEHLFPAPGRVAEARTIISRARSDHLTWMEHRQAELLDEYAKIDDDHISRGVYASSSRLVERELARGKALRDLEEHQEQTHRKIEDALAKLGPIERRRIEDFASMTLMKDGDERSMFGSRQV